MKFKKIVVSGLIFTVFVWAVHLVLPAYTDYRVARQQLHEVEKKLLRQQRDNEALQEANYKLKTDQKSIERVAREKFGWSRRGEKIYDFGN